MTTTQHHGVDLVVIGGGPAGSTISTLVAMQGHRVLLLERERFPRHQIGESLLPVTIHAVCAMLGVLEEVKAAGFVRKLGGTFRWGKRAEPWTFTFGVSPELVKAGAGYAFQVERSRFDQMLLDNARRRGVDVRERHAVQDVLVDRGRVVGVRYVDEAGQEHTARARFVVDASGHASSLHRHAGERVYSEFFRNVALFCYFANAKRMPGELRGNVLSATFPEGWFWFIPLSDTLTSVGAVVARDHAEMLRRDHDSVMRGFIDSCPLIKDLLSSATRVTEGPYGRLRIRSDYSYINSRFWRPGLSLIGDAACFVDPIFSTGVHLATYSGLLAARSINTALRGELTEEQCFTEFEKRYRAEYEYENVYRFLAFYDLHQDEQSYFWTARKILNTPERDHEAFVRLVSGLSTVESSIFDTSKIVSEHLQVFEETADWRVLQNISHLIRADTRDLGAQVLSDGHRPPEQPRFEGGLVPSADGLRWTSA